ncbi:helix-turn-helix transcriptional regulator [Streptomyces marianii]|uniref:WYL domain-containing protein n=1 Tax=Streptomyces marianii TaxID=1817406 RepID=A0A5R9DWS7_9ACTN|nr:WYL domain-containing protein [Streptomyces marianii]TLQ39322.1 WYL domain-containing protein [Streptomyces marianii]
MVDTARARQLGIVHVLRSRTTVPARDLASRFGVSERTIYRDITALTAHGIPIQATPGKVGGYRLAPESALDPLTIDSDHALRLYVLGFLDTADQSASAEERARTAGVSDSVQDVIRRLAQRIHFDTADWYWRDEGSGHLPVLRTAMLTATALEATWRTKDGQHKTGLLKPYGAVWKAGEWHMVAAHPTGAPARFRLNLVDRLHPTDLTFAYPEDFSVREWWQQTMEDYGKGDVRVTLRVAPAARDELLRLSLKSTSRVHEHDDGSLTIVLFVDRWEWLIPLVTSYGPDVEITEPAELRTAIVAQLRSTLAVYDTTVPTGPAPPDGLPHDDSRLRTTHGRHPGA